MKRSREIGDGTFDKSIKMRKLKKINEENKEMNKINKEFIGKYGKDVKYIGPNSWICILKGYHPPASEAEFKDTFNQHPKDFRKLLIHGQYRPIPRWQQSYGKSYKFSGTVSESAEPTPLIKNLIEMVNEMFFHGEASKSENENDNNGLPRFNMCLCNWYAPEHYIGPHSDDTRQLIPQSPIASLSWGFTRTFVLKPRKEYSELSDEYKSLKLYLSSGDLIIMGGDCQQTHKHEILKLKKNQIGGNRINFTFRCFKNE